MVDQRVAAEKQNGVGTPYIPPMTRRLKCRIDPGQSPYTCMLPEHKPVRRGREMIDLLALEKPKPKPAKIRAVSYEAAIDQLFKRMRPFCRGVRFVQAHACLLVSLGCVTVSVRARAPGRPCP